MTGTLPPMIQNALETILEAVLNSYQLRVEIVMNARYCGDWYEKEPETRAGQFHLIGEGSCWVSSPVLPAPVALQKGDLIVFPAGARHTLSNSADACPVGASTSDTTSMLCGEMEFVFGSYNPVMDALPRCLLVRSSDGGEAFRHLASVLLSLSAEPVLGQRTMMNKLADGLFTMAVCAHARQSGDARGVFAALLDPRLSKALAALHTDPARSWSLQQLADVAAMSRTVFAARFNDVVGMPPMQYLARWRIAEAKRLLTDRRLSMAGIAERVGYSTEAAFRRMFKRIEGIAPKRPKGQ
jgi:AraC-like DNA-binding protein